MTEPSLKPLRERIDQGLMVLDHALCEHGRRENVPRDQVAVVDLSLAALKAMISAFRQDKHLWADFQREVRGPRDVVFDAVFEKAHALGRAQTAESRDEALKVCDREGWARRINALAGDGRVDGLTVHAVAYVLGGNSQARREFFRIVQDAAVRT
jgi:hypothetical protein